MATTAVIQALNVKPSNSHSILGTIGRNVKKFFGWLGSPQGQRALGIAETGAEIVFPEATGVISVANVYLKEIFKTEVLAAAAGQQDGSGAIKSVITIGAVTPQALDFAQRHGLEPLTAAEIQRGVDLMVEFANLFKSKAAA